MSIQHYKFTNATSMKVFTYPDPLVYCFRKGKTACAFHIHVLYRVAYRLGRKEIYIQICRQGIIYPLHNAFSNYGVGFKGQMWTVIFVRPEWQDHYHV